LIHPLTNSIPINQKKKFTAASYEFVDKDPLSISFYRLRQIDNDGKETLSKVISISTKSNSKLKVFLNPVSDELNVTGLEGDYQIINLLGQVLLRDSSKTQIDVSALSQGTYLLRVGEEQVRFVKQ
jgi:Secretion system C-terminal sorting domain